MTIRAKPVSVKPTEKPPCRVHRKEMRFNGGTMRWECDVSDCRSVAYPKHEEDGRPILGKGDLELVIHVDEDGKEYRYIRATENNVMILIDDDNFVELGITPPGPATLGTAGARVKLFFAKIAYLDEYGKRRAERKKKRQT